MESIVNTALEEICCEGSKGIPLVTLWSRLSVVSPSVKSHIWRNLLAIPQLHFKAKANTVYGPSDPSIQLLEDALTLDLRIVANDKLRGDFFGLYDDSAIPAITHRVLERVALARGNGVLQNVLAKEFGMKGSKFFYYIELLKSRGLIVKQPAILRTKEAITCISTNMIYLTRYAKPLSSQQRYEVCEQDSLSETPVEATDNPLSDTLIKDFLPAMQAICDKLEQASNKVLVASDIRHDLGYMGSHSRRRAWRSVVRRLTDSHLVAEFDAVVNDKVERCLGLLKRFSAKEFYYSEKKQLLQFGRSIQKTEQTLELPLDNQIYDMVDAEGSKGLTVVEVCQRLGIDKKKSYSRVCSICLRAGMHIQAEIHKKATAFRVWTSPHAPGKPSDHPDKAENLIRKNKVPINDFGAHHDTGGLAQISIEYSLAVSDADFASPAKLTDSESISEVLNCSQSNAKRRKLLPRRNLQESFHEIADKVVDAAMGSPDLALSEMDHLVQPELAKAKVRQPINVENSRRGLRILERLNEEKFVLRAELHKWFISLETDRSSALCRKTIDRILDRLQQEVPCKCRIDRVPYVTKSGRNRSIAIVLHPSIQTSDVTDEIQARIKSFELGLRGQSSLKRKCNGTIPILNNVQRGRNNGKRVKAKPKDRNHAVENRPSTSRKRKRATRVKTTEEVVRSIIVDGKKVMNSDVNDVSNSENFLNSIQEDQTSIPVHQEHNQQENAGIRDLSGDEGQFSSIINPHASSKTTSAPSLRFLWTDEADRKLLSQYVRHRAALGAKSRVKWDSIPELPAPPSACMRRTHRLMMNVRFRTKVLTLCNLLSARYAKHLETKQKCLPERNSSHVLVRFSTQAIGGTEWDDFSEKSINKAFNDVLELKKMAKLGASKQTRNGSQGSEMVPPENHSEDIQKISVDQVKDTTRRSGQHHFHQTLKPLDEQNNGSIQVRKSLAISTAVELLKSVFLSMPNAPGMQNFIEDTLRQYSEQDLFSAYCYLRDKKFLVGGSEGQPFTLSQKFLHSMSKSPFPLDTGTRASKFSSWLLEHERDLMAGGVALTSDLQCGDVLNLLSSVASGELSISLSLPEEGVGEPEDLRGLKRGAADTEESEPNNVKRPKLLREGEIHVRKEKGFPGIAVLVRRVTLPTAIALDLLKDDESRTGKLCINSGETSSGCDSDDMKKLFNSTDATVIPGTLGDSRWQAMASFASCIMSESTEEPVNLCSAGVFEAVSNALQKAGDQGLSIEDVHRLINIPSQETRDCIVDVLQTFGAALKVNGYNNFRVVHSLYRSKYFLTLEEGGTSQNGEQSLPVNNLEREHRSNDIFASGCSTSQDKRDHIPENSVHNITNLDLPEMAQTSGSQEASIKAPSVTFGRGIQGITEESTSKKLYVPIYPWVNADGSINKRVFDGLVRRVLGTVMQNPGIPEGEIINLMDVLNPQSCRKLLEMMTLDGYMKVREMVQTKNTGPPSLLAGLLSTGPRNPKLICRKHLFANSKGLSAL